MSDIRLHPVPRLDSPRLAFLAKRDRAFAVRTVAILDWSLARNSLLRREVESVSWPSRL